MWPPVFTKYQDVKLGTSLPVISSDYEIMVLPLPASTVAADMNLFLREPLLGSVTSFIGGSSASFTSANLRLGNSNSIEAPANFFSILCN